LSAHLVAVGLEVILQFFPQKELFISSVEVLLGLSEGRLCLGWDGMRRDVEVNVTGGVANALLLFVLLYGFGLRNLGCFFSTFFGSLLRLGLSFRLGFLGLLLLRRNHWYCPLDRDLFHLGPGLLQLGRLEVCDLMDAVLNFDYEFYFATLIGVLHLSFLDRVISQLEGETLHELGTLLVVDEEVHVSELVLEAQGFGDGERSADVEEGHHLGRVGLVLESVGD